jgi:hypothetical protein
MLRNSYLGNDQNDLVHARLVEQFEAAERAEI